MHGNNQQYIDVDALYSWLTDDGLEQLLIRSQRVCSSAMEIASESRADAKRAEHDLRELREICTVFTLVKSHISLIENDSSYTKK